LERDTLAHRALRGGLYLAVVEREQRDAAPRQLALQDLNQRLQLEFVVRGEDQRFAFDLDVRDRMLEVETVRDLAQGLINRVLHFLHVHPRNDVEETLLSHGLPLTLPLDPDLAAFPHFLLPDWHGRFEG